MIAKLIPTLLAGLLQATPVEVSIATVPSGSRIDLTLVPNGDVEIRREATVTRVKVEIDRAEPLSDFRGDLRSWVVWAVSPEGDFENIGELEPNGRGARLETVTSYARFGILVTAEPHFRVARPGETVAFRSGRARRNDTRIDPLRIEIRGPDYSGVALAPQGGIHPRVTQARMAVALAETEASVGTSSPRLREARVALDSLEQLLRRDTPPSVVLPYADDAIRLADLVSREARTAADQDRLRDSVQRIRDLERSLEVAREDRDRIEARERDASARINELLAEIGELRNANRTLTIERDSRAREFDRAEAEIRALRNPWPPVREALIYGFGARETPRGLVLTLPGNAFGRDGLQPEIRELLSGLGATLTFGETPEVWIEVHSRQTNAQVVSEARAEAVRSYLVGAGMPETRIEARGMGDRSPIPGADEAQASEIDERIEIIVREFGAL